MRDFQLLVLSSVYRPIDKKPIKKDRTNCVPRESIHGKRAAGNRTALTRCSGYALREVENGTRGADGLLILPTVDATGELDGVREHVGRSTRQTACKEAFTACLLVIEQSSPDLLVILLIRRLRMRRGRVEREKGADRLLIFPTLDAVHEDQIVVEKDRVLTWCALRRYYHC